MIRLVSTLHGARRAWAGPILRLLDGDESQFVVGMSGAGIVSAIANDPSGPSKVDGSVDVLDLMAGNLVSSPPIGPEAGDDQRQGVTEAGHTVLDMADNLRGQRLGRAELLERATTILGLRPGNVQAEGLAAVTAAACLILVAEDVDRELAK